MLYGCNRVAKVNPRLLILHPKQFDYDKQTIHKQIGLYFGDQESHEIFLLKMPSLKADGRHMTNNQHWAKRLTG